VNCLLYMKGKHLKCAYIDTGIFLVFIVYTPVPFF